jgi:hypothetical protein
MTQLLTVALAVAGLGGSADEGRAPGPDQVIALLAAGTNEEFVAEVAGCADIAQMESYALGIAPLEGEQYFALVSAPFDKASAAAASQRSTETALVAEVDGLVGEPFTSFSFIGRRDSGFTSSGGFFQVRPLIQTSTPFSPTMVGPGVFGGDWLDAPEYAFPQRRIGR